MMKTMLLSAAAVSLMTAASFAQTTTPSTPGTATPPAATAPSAPASPLATAPSTTSSMSGDLLGSRLMDLDVRNAQDEALGEIDDIVIGSDGKITHVIVSTGGVLGVGAKKVQLPWSDVKVDAAGGKATASMTAEQLKSAPEYKAPPRAAARERGPATTTGSTPPMGDRPASRP